MYKLKIQKEGIIVKDIYNFFRFLTLSINVSLLIKRVYTFLHIYEFLVFIKIIGTFFNFKNLDIPLSRCSRARLLSIAPLKRNVKAIMKLYGTSSEVFYEILKNTGEVIRRIPAIMNLPRKWKAAWWRIFDDSIVQYFVAALLNNLARDMGKGLYRIINSPLFRQFSLLNLYLSEMGKIRYSEYSRN